MSKFDQFKTRETPLYGGVQTVYTFENGWGASVVRRRNSYGFREGLWELAVLGKAGRLDYSATITDDVIASQTDEQIEALLARIQALPEDVQEANTEQRKDRSPARGLEALVSLAAAVANGDVRVEGERS